MKDVTGKMKRKVKAVANTTDDKLGWAMRFLRAMEEVRLTTASQCVRVYPDLRRLANPDNPNSRLGNGLDRVRQHAGKERNP